MKKLLALLVTAVLAVSLVACGRVKIDGMTLPESQILNKGDSIQLTPAFASEKEKNEDKIAKAAEKLTLEWATSDETVATVDETGLVTAVGAGKADITVKISEREITAVCAITVEIKADGVNAPEAMEFTVGDEGKSLDAKITPEDATNVVLQYNSSDENIATVDKNGVVTPVAAGECTIKTSVVSASDAKAEAEDKAVVVDAATEENADEAQAAVTSEDASQVDAASEDAVLTGEAQDKPDEDVLASAETKVTVKAAEVKAEATNKTLNNKSASTSSTSHAQPAPSQSTATTTTPSQATTAPSQSESTPAPNPAPAPAPAPEPAPAPVPDPEPEPAPGGNINEGTGRDNSIIEGGGTDEGNGEGGTPMPD